MHFERQPGSHLSYWERMKPLARVYGREAEGLGQNSWPKSQTQEGESTIQTNGGGRESRGSCHQSPRLPRSQERGTESRLPDVGVTVTLSELVQWSSRGRDRSTAMGTTRPLPAPLISVTTCLLSPHLSQRKYKLKNMKPREAIPLLGH